MKTHEQPAAQLDDHTRAYTRAMADVCKRDPALFAALVRAVDQMIAAGVPVEEARRQALKSLTD